MSLLQQGTTSGLDDASRGEEYTKGSSHIVWASIVAAIVVTVAIAAYIILGQKPPVATGDATNVVAHMMHRETSGYDASGAAMPKEEFDQVLLFAHLKLHNQSKNPLFLRQILGNITLDDGIHSSYVATPTDYERLFAAYPDLATLKGTPLAMDGTIPAGQTMEGEIVASFRMTRAEFESRKTLNYTVSFRYQPDMTLTPEGPIHEE